MLIIKDKKDLKKHLDNDKVIGAIDIGGIAHEGHSFIIDECKKLVDILIVIYVSWNHPAYYFYKGIPEVNFPTFDEVAKSLLKDSKNIDFLVFSPITDSINNQIIRNNKNKELCYNCCKDLEVIELYPWILLSPIYDEDLKDLNYFTGPKNILIDLISKKILNSDEVYNPKYLWNSIRDKNTFHIISRNSNKQILGLINNNIYNEIISNGSVDINKINEIKNKSNYIDGLNIPIIDLKTLEKINKTTDNCAIVSNVGICFDYLFIKDGKIIF